MNINFQKITKNNIDIVLSLHVKPTQKNFIETTSQCLNEANNLDIWRPIAICDESNIIGFAMYGLFPDEGANGRVWLDRFLIDEKYQGKGYGKMVLPLLISHIQNEYNCTKIYLSIYENNSVALNIYINIGFKFNGEFDINGEKVMVLNLL